MTKWLQGRTRILTAVAVAIAIIVIMWLAFPKALSAVYLALHEVGLSARMLYGGNLGYLWTSLILALEMHLFALAIFAIFAGEVGGRVFKIPKWFEATYKGLFHTVMIVFRHVMLMVYEAWTTARREAGRVSKSKPEDRIDNQYFMFSFVVGVVGSIVLIIVYEVNAAVFWTLTILYLLVVLLYMWSLGVVTSQRGMARQIGVYLNEGNLTIRHRYGGVRRLTISEGTVALGLSIGTGMCGIITTLGSAIVRAPILFTLVPITFDMISVLTAMIEFHGLKAISRLMSELRGVEVSGIAMLLIISWSVYVSGVLMAALKAVHAVVSTGVVLTTMFGVWVIIAITLSIYIKRIAPTGMKVTRRMLMTTLTASAIPLLLLLV